MSQRSRWESHKADSLRADCLLAIAADRSLPPRERDVLTFAVYTYLNRHASFWIGTGAIAAELHLSRRTIAYSFAWLRSREYLNCARHGGGAHRTCAYVVMLPPVLDRFRRSWSDWQALLARLRHAYQEWLVDLFREHIRHGDDCARFAPSRLQPRELGP